jgi:hypothetical protein
VAFVFRLHLHEALDGVLGDGVGVVHPPVTDCDVDERYVVLSTCADDVETSQDVRLCSRERIADGFLSAKHSSQVDDAINVTNCVGNQGRVLDVSKENVVVMLPDRDMAVEDTNVMSTGEELFNDIPSDESVTACDQRVFHAFSIGKSPR